MLYLVQVIGATGCRSRTLPQTEVNTYKAPNELPCDLLPTLPENAVIGDIVFTRSAGTDLQSRSPAEHMAE